MFDLHLQDLLNNLERLPPSLPGEGDGKTEGRFAYVVVTFNRLNCCLFTRVLITFTQIHQAICYHY